MRKLSQQSRLRLLGADHMTKPVDRPLATFQCVRHVAVFEDGTVKITKGFVSVMMPEFNRDFEWETIPEKPTELQWIGNYPADM